VSNFIQHNFSKAASIYDENARLQKRIAYELIARSGKFIKKAKTMLDIGSGTGFLNDILLEKNWGKKFDELDFSTDMLAASKAKDSNRKSILGNINNLKLEPNGYNFIASSMAMQWADDLANTFNSMHKILANKGAINIACLVGSSLHELRNLGLPTINFKSPLEYMAHANKAGFKKVSVETEDITYEYASLFDLLRSIKNIGANYTGQGGMLSKSKLAKLADEYADKYPADKGVYATWQVMYLSCIK